jgi:hypothetical protein
VPRVCPGQDDVGTVIDHCEQVPEPLVLVFARVFVFASSSVLSSTAAARPSAGQRPSRAAVLNQLLGSLPLASLRSSEEGGRP